LLSFPAKGAPELGKTNLDGVKMHRNPPKAALPPKLAPELRPRLCANRLVGGPSAGLSAKSDADLQAFIEQQKKAQVH
jgi:hypothetical protein